MNVTFFILIFCVIKLQCYIYMSRYLPPKSDKPRTSLSKKHCGWDGWRIQRLIEGGEEGLRGTCPAHQSGSAVCLCFCAQCSPRAGRAEAQREREDSEQDCAHLQLMIGPTVLWINHSGPWVSLSLHTWSPLTCWYTFTLTSKSFLLTVKLDSFILHSNMRMVDKVHVVEIPGRVGGGVVCYHTLMDLTWLLGWWTVTVSTPSTLDLSMLSTQDREPDMKWFWMMSIDLKWTKTVRKRGSEYHHISSNHLGLN